MKYYEGRKVKIYVCETPDLCFSKKGICTAVDEIDFEIEDERTGKRKTFKRVQIQNVEEL